MSALIGAERYERTEERTNQRNGARHRPWDTRVGTIDLAIPKLRSGSYFPAWLEPRRRVGTSAGGGGRRGVPAWCQYAQGGGPCAAVGHRAISKSEVSRLCASLDTQVTAFRTRRLDAEYPYIFLDARYEHVREDERAQSMAVVIVYGIRWDGMREVLGVDVTNCEDLELWRAFLQDLVARGVRGVKLVISDAHRGLKQAIAEVLLGAGWQTCRVRS